MSDNNNNNDPNEFEDEAFDLEEEFEDVDLDETAYDEADFSEDVDGDVEYSDEEFSEEEWQDDAAAMAADPNNKKLYRGGKEKKSFLSFNTMVIIGALVLGGGVLVFTVMSKSQEASQAQGNIFRSMLNITDIMDGGIFGDKKEEAPAPETTATEQTSADGGFLNNPDQLATTDTAVPADSNPPQPTPIAPAQDMAAPNEPLTPMPEDQAQVPRAPDADVPAIDPAPAPTADVTIAEPNKAEELLKEAMANREDDEAAPAAEAIPTPVPPAPVEAAAPPSEPPAAEVIAEPAPAVPAEQAPAVVATPVADDETKQNVKNLEAKLDDVLNRMTNLESQLNTVRNASAPASSGTGNLDEITRSVESLKQDISELKSRPATVVEKVVTKATPAEEPKAAPAPKKKATTKKASSETAYKAPSSPSRWELRAAQPGKAWVSKPGERDMRGVQVGETLPGIGQITGILYQGGRWTVQGTQGQINQ